MAKELSVEEIFSKELKSSEPDISKLAALLNDHPGLMTSGDMLKRLFPQPPTGSKGRSGNKNTKGNLGYISTKKLMNALGNAKKLKDAGIITEETYKSFLNAKHPKTGDTFASYVAGHATVAFDKSRLDRSPKANLDKKDAQIFNDCAKEAADALVQMRDMGVSFEERNNSGKNVFDMLSQGKARDKDGSYPLYNAVCGNEASNDINLKLEKTEELAVGGDDLNLRIAEKKPDINIATKAPQQDDEKQATIEQPKEDGGSKSDFEPEKVIEKDIIDYMYNEWFLAGLSWLINKTVKTAYNIVANLCDKSVETWNNHKLENHDIEAKDFKKSADQLLASQQARKNEFNNKLDQYGNYIAAVNKDFCDNLGKTPQKWTTLNPADSHDAALISMMNTAYAKNPQKVKNQLGMLAKINNPGMISTLKLVHDLAVNMATVQFLHDSMNSKHDKLSGLSEKELTATMRNLTAKNFSSIINGLNAVATHTQLATMLRDGITDPKVIAENVNQTTDAYLKLLQQQSNIAVQALKADLDKGSFKLNGQKSQTNTKDEIDKMTRLVSDGEKQWDVLMPQKRAEFDQLGFYEAARSINAKNVIEQEFSQSIFGQLNELQAKTYDNSTRKKNFEEYKKKLLSNDKFMNYDSRDNQFANIYSQRRTRSGR